MVKLRLGILLLACGAALPAGGALADEIVFKEKFGGERVKCEIYKEDEDYVHYVDVARKMDCGASRQVIEKIVRDEKPLIDVEAFFLEKARSAKDREAREKAALIAEELRKKREAAAKSAAIQEKKVGKLRIRPSTGPGVKVLPSKDTGSNELLVDPFPEEGGGPKTEAEKEPAPKGRRKPRK